MSTYDSTNFRWSVSTGPQLLEPVWPSISQPSILSGNGQVVLGNYYHLNSPADQAVTLLPARWDGSTLTQLAMLPAMYWPRPNCCSFDGSIVYGNNHPSGPSQIIRWTNGGTHAEYLAQTGSGCMVSDCSADGSIAVGWDGDYFNYSNAQIWTNGTPSLLAGGGSIGALKVSSDGSRILGWGNYPYGSQTIVYWQNGVWRRLTTYSPTGVYRSPDSPHTNKTITIVTGYADRRYGFDQTPGTPVYWDNLDTSKVESDGLTYWGVMHDIAIPAGFSLAYVSDISDDGTVFVGYATQDATQIIFPIKWTNNVPTILPTISADFPGFPPTSGRAYPYACSADGSIVWGNIGYLTVQFQVGYWDASNTLHLIPFPEPMPTYYPFMSLIWPQISSVSRDGTAMIAQTQVAAIRGWTLSSPTTSVDTGAIGDFWADDTYVDFSDPSVLAKFIDPNGRWLTFGKSGELPTGQSPIFWNTVLSGNAPDDFILSHGSTTYPWQLYLYGQNPVTDTPYPYELTFDDCEEPRSLKLVSLYPFHEPTSEYAFIADSNFDSSFTRFSISVWCCKSVHIESPSIIPSGFFTLPLMPGGKQGMAQGISADGHTVVGWVSPPSDDSFQIACYWTDGAGPFILTNPDPVEGDFAIAQGASGDGSIIVGVILYHHPDGNYSQPFRWTAAGGLELDAYAIPGQATCISADGSRMVGWAGAAPYQACYWDASAARTDLGCLPGDNYSQATAVSADGKFIVGYSMHGQTFATFTTARPFLWSAATGMVNLGFPSGVGALWATATGVSDDGKLVSGVFGTSGQGGSWKWTPTGGTVEIPLATSSFQGSVSGDGGTIVGDHTAPQDGPHPPFGGSIGYMRDGVVTVPMPIPMDPVNYPDTIQTTSGYGVSADGAVMVGATNQMNLYSPYYLPFVYHLLTPPVPAITMDFSSQQITITMYGVDGSLRFKGTWSVPSPSDEYQVLFSVDTSAQTYALYVNNVAPIGTPIWGIAGPIGWA